MPSFDIVSKLDWGEVKNAIVQAQKEISTRYDFKGSKASIEHKDKCVELIAEDDTKLRSARDVLMTKMAKRGIGLKSIEVGDATPTGNMMLKQVFTLKSGVDKDQGKTINKLIKQSGIKVTSSYMDEKIRVQGKKIDDLQEVFAFLRSSKEVEIEIQMENMKRD